MSSPSSDGAPAPPPRPRALVTKADLLKARRQIDERGTYPVIQQLEAAESDLTEVLIEELTELHHDLRRANVSLKRLPRFTARTWRLFAWLTLAVLIAAKRRSGSDPRD